MTSGLRRRKRPSLVLVVLCGILGAVIYLELALGSHPRPVSHGFGSSEPVTIETPEPGFTMPALDDFSEIAARPLFLPSRRPLPPEEGAAQSGSSAIQRQQFTLLGVIIFADERMAVLQRRNSRQVLRVVEGQQIDGWVVDAVMPDHVVLRQRDVIEEVSLSDRPRFSAEQSAEDEAGDDVEPAEVPEPQNDAADR